MSLEKILVNQFDQLLWFKSHSSFGARRDFPNIHWRSDSRFATVKVRIDCELSTNGEPETQSANAGFLRNDRVV